MIRAFCLLLTLLVCAPAFGANKFTFLASDQPIPREQFIYAVLDLRNGELHLGHSKGPLQFANDGKIVGGVRNGGHAMLLCQVLGIEPTVAALKPVLPEAGKGFAVGGGFILGKDGKVHLHISNTNKAAGQLATLAHTMNPLLPETNGEWAALLPEKYAFEFYRAIAKRVGQPLVYDGQVTESERFKFNAAKHKNARTYIRSVVSGTRWMTNTIDRVNQQEFGIKPPERPLNVTLENFDYESNVADQKANARQLFAGEAGEKLFREIFITQELFLEPDRKIVVLDALLAENIQPRTVRGTEKFLAGLPSHALDTNPKALAFTRRLLAKFGRLTESQRKSILTSMTRFENIPLTVVLPVVRKHQLERFFYENYFASDQHGQRFILLLPRLSPSAALTEFLQKNAEGIFKSVERELSKYQLDSPTDKKFADRFLREFFHSLPGPILGSESAYKLWERLEKVYNAAGQNFLGRSCADLTLRARPENLLEVFKP